MSLTTTQLTQYRETGYTTAPDFFEREEVAAMQAELLRLKEAGLLHNVATEGDGKTASTSGMNLQICPLAPKSELFRSLGFADKVVETIRQAYFGIKDRRQGVGMWTAIHAANVANGTMHVIPRGDVELLSHERDGGSNHHIKCVVDESQAVPIELPAGGVLFFNYAVPHCTKGNTTDRERAGLALHFLREEAVVKPENKIATLTGPNTTHGVSEFGTDQRGSWDRQVEHAATAV
jgi:ectoine hydroxylase-related dioxygenase (phytanoyl-CoA dioxygenase family)